MAGASVLTVIIPTKDCLNWLPTAVESIGQREDIEILIVDDGSQDGTDVWLSHAASRDHRIRPLIGAKAGPSAARNAAIKLARAPLIAFLDADDAWLPGKLDVQLAFHASHPELALSFTDYRHISPSGADLGTCFQFWPRFHARNRAKTEPFVMQEDGLAQIYAENVIGTSTVVARADLLRECNGFADELPTSEDWDLWLRLARRAPIGCVPGVFVNYLSNRPGNQTGQRRARILSMRIIAARYREDARSQDYRSLDVCDARVLGAQAELEEFEGHKLRALALRLSAFRRHPTQRTLVEATAGIMR